MFSSEPGTGFHDFNHDGQEWIGVNRIRSYIFPSGYLITCEGKPRARPGGISWSQSTRKAHAKFMQPWSFFQLKASSSKETKSTKMAGQTTGWFSIWQALARPQMLPVVHWWCKGLKDLSLLHSRIQWQAETVLLRFHFYKWNSMRCFELLHNLNSRLLGDIPADGWKAGSPPQESRFPTQVTKRSLPHSSRTIRTNMKELHLGRDVCNRFLVHFGSHLHSSDFRTFPLQIPLKMLSTNLIVTVLEGGSTWRLAWPISPLTVAHAPQTGLGSFVPRIFVRFVPVMPPPPTA